MNVAFFAPEVVARPVWCTNGVFSAPEVVAQFSVRDLVSHRGLPYTFFNDPGTISLSGPVEGNRNVRVTGTPMNDAYYELEKKMLGFM